MQIKRVAAYMLDALILLCIVVCCGLVNTFITERLFRLTVQGVLIAIGAGIIGFEIKCFLSMRKKATGECRISKLVLLGVDSRPIKMWDLTGKVGLLIGKSSSVQEAQIDLSQTAFHAVIEDAHAVLNYAAEAWWLEDISTKNGVKIERRGGDLLLAAKAPAKLMAGDVICIAENTRLAVN